MLGLREIQISHVKTEHETEQETNTESTNNCRKKHMQTMTVVKKQKDWLIDNFRCICMELYTIKCIGEIGDRNDQHSNLYVILMKCIKQLQSKYLTEAIIITIKFMQIYIEAHLYFHGVLHDANGIKHIAHLLPSCDILHNINLFVEHMYKYYHWKQILYLNVFAFSAEYIINNYFKFEGTVYSGSNLCQNWIQLYDSTDCMENINKNVITHNIASKSFASLCDSEKWQQIHNGLQMN